MREGSGAGHGIDVDLGQAHESALKEAETARASTAAEPPAQAGVPAAQQDLGLLRLDAATIRTLHGPIRQLPRPLLEALTRGFRKRFSIPEEARRSLIGSCRSATTTGLRRF